MARRGAVRPSRGRLRLQHNSTIYALPGGRTLLHPFFHGGWVRNYFPVCALAIQVSIDSLWTLRKLREEGDDDDQGGGAGSRVFDRDSLRAMPLGIGLQYASLSESQRAEIARRYTQGAPVGGRALGSAAVAATGGSRPPSPATSPAASGHGEGVHWRRHISSQRAPRSPPPSPGGIALSPAFEGGETPVGLSPSPSPLASASASASPRSAELHRISLSQVDRDVLDCLPQEVREEVLRAIASNAGGGGGGGGDGDVGADPNDASGGEAPSDDGPGPEWVDLRSPSPPTPSPQRERPEPLRELGGRNGGSTVFDAEPAETLRGALRAWIGGAVPSPSQWHLELLYR